MLLKRLQEWQIMTDEIHLLPGDAYGRAVPVNEQPTALRTALQQLSDLQAPGTVTLTGWQGTDVFAATLADCLPALPQLTFRLVLDSLTDALPGAVLQVAPRVRYLDCERLEVRSDQHSTAAWAWEDLRVGEEAYWSTIRLASLLRLPHPSTGGSACIAASEVVLEPHPSQVRAASATVYSACVYSVQCMYAPCMA